MFSSRSNFKLSFSKPKYETNGDTIRCTLAYAINSPDFNHDSRYNKDGAYRRDGQWVNVGLDLGVHQAVGTAKLSDKDTFDKKTGREVAEARAESAAYKHAQLIIDKYVTSVANQLISMSTDFSKKTERIKSHNREFVSKLVNFPEEMSRK